MLEPGEEPTARMMPVDAEGRATGPTVYTYAGGDRTPYAYYARCVCCPLAQPFYSPNDRDAWAEMHRAVTDHAMELTVEPWDYREPPWVAAHGLPLRPKGLLR